MSDYKNTDELAELNLGKATDYASLYDPSLLQAVPRLLGRSALGLKGQMPFYGEDVWHAYELSWLNDKGKPVVALARFTVPANSHSIVESKSLKLYLNSFNQTLFSSHEKVKETIQRDLSATAGESVKVELFAPDNVNAFELSGLPGDCIDNLDVRIETYDLAPEHLSKKTNQYQPCTEVLHSHLLKSNCLITNQPDWASVVIAYQGEQFCRESLLKYLVSMRMHNEFHEQCVERIFIDLLNAYDLKQLSVQALYTRRGGLDINPFRTTKEGQAAPLLRVNRQ